MHRNFSRHVALAALPFAFGLVACSRLSTAPEPSADLVLTVGDSVRIANASVRVLALQESRCPTDVYCIWQGDVTIILAFSGAGDARTDTVHLNIPPKTTTYGGIQFTPIAVLPYPKSASSSGETKTLTLHAEDIR